MVFLHYDVGIANIEFFHVHDIPHCSLNYDIKGHDIKRVKSVLNLINYIIFSQ